MRTIGRRPPSENPVPSAEPPDFGQVVPSPQAREFLARSSSIQPHGVLLVLAEPRLLIVQVSTNVETRLGWSTERLLGQSIDILGVECGDAVRELLETQQLSAPYPCRITLAGRTGALSATMLVQRTSPEVVIVELEDVRSGRGRRGTAALPARLAGIVTRLSAASSIPALAELVAEEMQDLIGHDRVMVLRFDDAGHSEVIAEARRPGMESFLHRHYAATALLPDAREQYLRHRVRHIVDGSATGIPLEPQLHPLTGEPIDLSRVALRDASSSHRHLMRTLGSEATLVASLVHEGRLWGLLSCHHREARYVSYDLRAACELLAEVVSTRISALEHFAEAQAEVLVRRLEHRLVEEAHDGDWRRALFDGSRQLLAPVGASGAALLHDGEIHTAGEVPSTVALRALFTFLDTQHIETVFSTGAIASLHPPLARITGVAAGVLAVRLGASRGEYLAWFRREQPHDIRWGDAARTEEVRGSAPAWSLREMAIAKAVGASLADIILQMRAVRVLIAESQLARMRAAVLEADEPVIIADEDGRVMLVNDALSRLVAGPYKELQSLDDLAVHFDDAEQVRQVFRALHEERRPWRGEFRLRHRGGAPGTPVALRADPIPMNSGGLFGVILVLNDLTARQQAEEARLRLQQAILQAQRGTLVPGTDRAGGPAAVHALVSAIWANAGVVASEIADSAETADIAPRLTEVEIATRQAARISALLGRYVADDEGAAGR